MPVTLPVPLETAIPPVNRSNTAPSTLTTIYGAVRSIFPSNGGMGYLNGTGNYTRPAVGPKRVDLGRVGDEEE